MSREFTIDKKGGKTVTADIANIVNVDPLYEELRFQGNTEENFKKLIIFFKMALKQADDEKGVTPNYKIIENSDNKELVIKGDSEYVVKMCKRMGLFDEKSADDMLAYLSNPNQSSQCSTL